MTVGKTLQQTGVWWMSVHSLSADHLSDFQLLHFLNYIIVIYPENYSTPVRTSTNHEWFLFGIGVLNFYKLDFLTHVFWVWTLKSNRSSLPLIHRVLAILSTVEGLLKYINRILKVRARLKPFSFFGFTFTQLLSG